MKKLLTILLSLCVLALVAGPAMAVPYTFEDKIVSWEHGSTHAYIPSDPETYDYRHDLNDDVEFHNGHMVTEAQLILKFDYVYGGTIQTREYTIDWDQAEEVYIDLEGTGSWYEVEDATDASYDLVIDWLNDDGFLDVSLSVRSDSDNPLGFLDYSIVKGSADDKPASVPEPASIFLLGAGLLGVAGARHKKN